MPTDPMLLPAINLSKLAKDVAMDIHELKDIQEAHQLTDLQWAAVMKDPQFNKMLGEMVTDWRSAAGARERVRVKAQVGVEAALDDMFAEISDSSIPFSQRVEALKLMAKLGDLGERNDGLAAAGGGISININLGVPGQGKPPVTIEQVAIALPAEEVTQ